MFEVIFQLNLMTLSSTKIRKRAPWRSSIASSHLMPFLSKCANML